VKKYALTAIALAMALALPALSITPAHAGTYTQKNALEPWPEWNELNNSNAPALVKTPKYSRSALYTKTNSYETKPNTIKTKKGNANYTFKTQFFLPITYKKAGDWSDTQSFAFAGDYLYVLSTVRGHSDSQAWITRYDTAALKAAGVDKAGTNMKELRLTVTKMGKGGSMNATEKKVKAAIKKGPVFNAGHGQGLSYNPVRDSLFTWSYKAGTDNMQLQEIDIATLKVKNTWVFGMFNVGGKRVVKAKGVFNLDWDSEGNFYFDQVQVSPSPGTSSGSVKIFVGQIKGKKVTVRALPQTIKHRPGTLDQGLGVNRALNRLYLVSDDAFYSLPLDKALAGELKKTDMEYTVLDSKRECEGIKFDEQGRAYMLINSGSEIIRATEILD
jgi:hypothetical protein